MKDDDTIKQCAANVTDIHHLILELTCKDDEASGATDSDLVSYMSEKLDVLTPAECEMTNLVMDILRRALGAECSTAADGSAMQFSGR